MKRVGVDIGGTFTDILILDEESGHLQILKVPSTPGNVAEAAIAALHEAIAIYGLDPRNIRYVAHGSTVGTNAIIERKGAKTGLITTRGFRDVLELGRVARPAELLYDIFQDRPAVLVPRHLRREVGERLSYEGEVLAGLERGDVDQIMADFSRAGVKAVAVCLLFSYANPQHEAEIAALIRGKYPEVYVTLSSGLAPVYGEYERTSTAVVNSYIGPLFSQYVSCLDDYVGKQLGTRLYIMQSNGGIVTAEAAGAMPVRVLESGPTAGVIAAAFVGGLVGVPDAISFDMGGTTAKAGLILGGQTIETVEYEVGGVAALPGGGHVHGRGTGFPISLPAVEVTEVGSGGGSVAWIDPSGAFRVGPRSMGSRPGPACYGLGGEEPTVTDAKLILGGLNPGNFLGGQMPLYPELSRQAIQEKLGTPLGLSVVEAARGIVTIANAKMAQAVRLVSINKGHDPRAFVLVAFGGAGPMHACEVAREMDIPWVIVPRFPGVHSSLGLVATDIVHDFLAAYPGRIPDARAMATAYEDLEARAWAALNRDTVPLEARRLLRTADVRYEGQTYTLNIPVGGGQVTADGVKDLLEGFHARHLAFYGFRSGDEAVEVANLRVRAVGTVPRPVLGVRGEAGRSVQHAGADRRPVFFEAVGDFVVCPVFERSMLPPGSAVKGPAVVEQVDSTIEIPPDMVGTVDKYLNIIIGKDEWNGQLQA